MGKAVVPLVATLSTTQYGISDPWLHENPSERLTKATMTPNAVTRVPNVAMAIGMMFFLERIGSCRNFITHIGGMMNAKGEATMTPCNCFCM